MKDVPYVINLDENNSIITHWIARYVKNNIANYVGRFGVKHISKEI